MRLILLLSSILVLGISHCNVPIVIDDTMSPLEAGDPTALIEGCGNQLVSGYTYCRVREGDNTGLKLTIVAPITECKKTDGCAYYKIYFPTGEPTLGGVIPKGQSSVSIFWSELTKKTTFDVGDRGFWPVLVDIFWLDKDGNERRSTTEGEIRLRVYRSSYTPLHEISNDPNFAWEFHYGKIPVKVTTNLRAYVGKK